ncbi:hypothetical protein RRH01S_07_00010 [Rhizobium rhizogenes NBRC 13257]|uniref:Uncharacterized protein n=1 Tax=Rhizobium rhizogenes NBRC 13257 TaxID=1220581 RepID=A0AA87Q7D4_RHIRH|nr:hypothetical protein RRH01S_07_00010 [Rhizobium rhizogenes NBRC 13257]
MTGVTVRVDELEKAPTLSATSLVTPAGANVRFGEALKELSYLRLAPEIFAKAGTV